MYEFYENIKLISNWWLWEWDEKISFYIKNVKKHTIKITQIKNLF